MGEWSLCLSHSATLYVNTPVALMCDIKWRHHTVWFHFNTSQTVSPVFPFPKCSYGCIKDFHKYTHISSSKIYLFLIYSYLCMKSVFCVYATLINEAPGLCTKTCLIQTYVYIWTIYQWVATFHSGPLCLSGLRTMAPGCIPLPFKGTVCSSDKNKSSLNKVINKVSSKDNTVLYCFTVFIFTGTF